MQRQPSRSAFCTRKLLFDVTLHPTAMDVLIAEDFLLPQSRGGPTHRSRHFPLQIIPTFILPPQSQHRLLIVHSAASLKYRLLSRYN